MPRSLWAKFQRAIPAYPLPGRMLDRYESYEYTPEEVKEFREGCTRLKAGISNLRAERALRKLIYACDEAMQRGSSLVFSSD